MARGNGLFLPGHLAPPPAQQQTPLQIASPLGDNQLLGLIAGMQPTTLSPQQAVQRAAEIMAEATALMSTRQPQAMVEHAIRRRQADCTT